MFKFTKRQKKLLNSQFYDRLATREDLGDIMHEMCRNAFNKGYQKGYRTGRNYKEYDAEGERMMQAL